MKTTEPNEPREKKSSGSMTRDELKIVLRERRRKMQLVAEKNGLKNIRFVEHPELDDD